MNQILVFIRLSETQKEQQLQIFNNLHTYKNTVSSELEWWISRANVSADAYCRYIIIGRLITKI